jgi:putative spermidine/putrescine transport system ATP-binding protein
MQQPFVRFDHVEKSYDGKQLVVRDLTLDIAQGEFLTLLGPSGSGKTTTLMMLAGFETATSGEIYLDGKPINRIAPEHRNIGMVFQSYALFPHMTVAENVGFPLSVRGITGEAAHSRVMAALDKVGLKGLESRRPAQMSGGQQQRVAVARALAARPALVLADEPTASLDPENTATAMDLIQSACRADGAALLCTSHDPTLRARFARVESIDPFVAGGAA